MRPVLYAFRRNLVVAASAGTGKTHGLVGVLVHLLLGASELGQNGRLAPAVDPGRIVATTFSRKAAAEIRARLVEELERLAAHDPGAKYRADLDAACASASVAPWLADEVAQRARRALDGVSRAQIGTLHGYASSIARAYALEAGLSPSFAIAGEDEGRVRIEEAIVRVLEARAAHVRELVDAAGGVDRTVAQIAAALAKLDEDGRGAEALELPDGDAEALDAMMRTLADHARALAREPKYEEVASAFLAARPSGEPDRLVAATIALVGLRATKCDAIVAFQAFRERLDGETNADKGRRLARAWLAKGRFATAARAARELLVACQDEIAREVRRTSELGFGDVLRVARDVMRQNVHVAREVGRGVDVFLVDEFQDTSRLQRDLVQLVWGREDARLAGEVPGPQQLRAHGLFVVGDRKQSIYAFRGADVSVFAEMCVGLAGAPAREALGIAPGAAWEPAEPIADFVSLRHNRRGNAGLLAFANAFSRERFRVREPPAHLYEIEYVPETEDLLVPSERGGEAPVVTTTWLRALDATRLEQAHVIAERAAEIVARGEPKVGERAPTWRDLAVLAPTNEMLDAAAFALAEARIPHVVAGRGFYASTEVRDLARMLALAVDPRDARALLEVLRGPWAGVHDATLVGLTAPGRGLLPVGAAWDAGPRRALVRPEDEGAIARVRATVDALWRNVDRLGPGGVLREAVRALGLEEVLMLLPRGEQRVANVRKLVALADRETSCVRFLERLEERMERATFEPLAAPFSDDDDAVRLLTVHASKGLDFPIVFVPQIGSRPTTRGLGAIAIDLGSAGAQPSIAVKIFDPETGPLEGPTYARGRESAARRDRAERQRLSYVAVTRASHAMYLVGDATPPKKESLAYLATDAAALRALGDDAALAIVDVVPRPPAAREPPGPAAEPPAAPADPRVARPPFRALAIAPTALQDFAHCARRFQLMHVLGLPERRHPQTPGPPFAAALPRDDDDDAGPHLDARAEGTLAHRVLERLPRDAFGTREAARAASEVLAREGLAADHPRHAAVVERVARFAGGAYAARIAKAGAEVAREAPFVLRLPDAEGRILALRGSIDLLVTWPDGGVDVVDYKRARGPSADPYGFQLDVYALAARDLVPRAPRLRAGIVFLGGDADEPVWRPSPDAARFALRLAELAESLVRARWTETFPRVAPSRCRAIRCGYFRACHPGEPA